MGLHLICSTFWLINCMRWRKASKCKKLIKLLKHRLIIQTNRRNAMMRQLREDIAQLLQNGQHQSAFARVLQLHKDQHILLAYEQVENFCDYVLNNFDEITSQRKLSDDVREAVSSLIFAASRCGDMPELQSLRYFFKGILGQKFERANVELLPGNSVNSEIKRSLCIKSVQENVKNQIINEILREIEQNLGQPIKVQEPTFSEDGTDGIKYQIQTKKSGQMLREIDSKIALRDCENMITFASNSQDGSDGIASSFASRETNQAIPREKSHEGFTTENRTIGILTKMDAAIPCCHDKGEQPLQDEDSSKADQFNTVDFQNGLRMRRSTYLKAVKTDTFISCSHDKVERPSQIQDCLRADQFNTVNSLNGLRMMRPQDLKSVSENCHGSLKTGLKNSTNYPLASVTAQSSQNEEAVRDECGHVHGVTSYQRSPKDRKVFPRSPHVHPKLPEYDDLVVQFRNLKKSATGKKF